MGRQSRPTAEVETVEPAAENRLQRAMADTAVQLQCWRVSPGPDSSACCAGRQHAGLPRAGAVVVHVGRQRAQRQCQILKRAKLDTPVALPLSDTSTENA